MTIRSVPAPRLLVISQVYIPDPASVGQHVADAAEAMVRRGYDVLVLASANGYDDPAVSYPRRERRAGVEIVRLPLSSFGKRTVAHRLIGQLLFLFQVIVRGVFARRLAGVVVSTSPPMASFAALVIGFFRNAPIVYWLMDFNPDQAVALNKISPKHALVRAMRWLNRLIFSRADCVVVLDRFMAERVRRQYEVKGRLETLPPWPHNEPRESIAIRDNPFRIEHGLADRFVVMYSGNHSPASPVTTLVQAAIALRDDPQFEFLFIGGGLGKREVDEAIAATPAANIRSLPYQPLDQIKYSLSAADLHVVTLGDEMPGIVHPCKIYGAMSVGRPILLIGPRPSHAADLVDRHDIGWQVDQGDVPTTIATLRRIAALSPGIRAAMGERARGAIRDSFSRTILCNTFCDLVEDSLLAKRRLAHAEPCDHPRPNPPAAEAARSAPSRQTVQSR